MESAFRAFVQTKPRLILGSNSSSRKTLLSEVAKEFNFSYEVMTAGIDEKSIRREDPKDLVLVLGYEKAKAVVKRINHVPETETYVITGDQVVVHDDRILEKPESAEEIRSNIRRFSVTPASTVGSIVCTHLPSKKQLHRLDIASIYMESIPDDVIDNLIKEGTVFHSAGGLLAEHPLVAPFVTKIEGGLDSIMGLSKSSTISLLLEMWNNIKIQSS